MGLYFRAPLYYWTKVSALRLLLLLIVANEDFYTLTETNSSIENKYISFHWILCRLTMSTEDRQGFIVKFVECKGQKLEYSLKAYEVYPYWL